MLTIGNDYGPTIVALHPMPKNGVPGANQPETRDIWLGGTRSPAFDACLQVRELLQAGNMPKVSKLDNLSFDTAVQRDWLQRDYAKVAQGAWKTLRPWHQRVWDRVRRSQPEKPTLDPPSVLYSMAEKLVFVRADRYATLDQDAFFLPMLHAVVHQACPDYFTAVKQAFGEAERNLEAAKSFPPLWRKVGQGQTETFMDMNEGPRTQAENNAKIAQRRAWSRLGWLEAAALVLQRASKLQGNGPEAFERCLHEGFVEIASQAVHDGDFALTFKHPELVDVLSYVYTQVPLRVGYGQRECMGRQICQLACKALPATFVMPGFELEEATISDPANPRSEPLRAAQQLLEAGPSHRGLGIISQYVDAHPDSVQGLLLWADTVRAHMSYPDAVQEMYERVLKLDPTNAAAQKGLAKLAEPHTAKDKKPYASR